MIDRISKLAVVTGGKGFANNLAAKLQETVPDVEEYAWVKKHGRKLPYLDPLKLENSAKVLKENGVSHVIHAGSADILSIMVDQPFEVPTALNYYNNKKQYLTDYYKHLTDNGVTPISIGELSDEFTIGKGEITNFPISILERNLADTLGLAKNWLENNFHKNLPQSVVFDGANFVRMEENGTRSLLKKVSKTEKENGITRYLVKCAPEISLAKIDPPTIGSNTIDEAKKAKVDVILFDAENGVITDKEHMLECANQAGIVIYGV